MTFLTPPLMFTVKIDGNEIEVTEEEPAPKRGCSGQQEQYIQTQMQKVVARSRKEAEQTFNQLAQERAQVQQALQMLQDGTSAAPPTAPDEALFQTDPLQYMEQKLAYDKQVTEYQSRLGQLLEHAQANQETANCTRLRQVYLSRERLRCYKGLPSSCLTKTSGSNQPKSTGLTSAVEAFTALQPRKWG